MTSAGLLAVAAGAETSYPILGLAAGCRVRRPERDRDRAPRGDRRAVRGRPPAGCDQLAGARDAAWAACSGVGVGGVLIGDTPRLAALRGRGRRGAASRGARPSCCCVRMERRPPSPAPGEEKRGVPARGAAASGCARGPARADPVGRAATSRCRSSSCSTPITCSTSAPAPRPGCSLAFGILTGGAMVVGGPGAARSASSRCSCSARRCWAAAWWPRLRPASVAAAACRSRCAAVGAGLVTALGFPYFARFVPSAEAGSYSGLYFSVRAIAATVAVPLAGVADRADRLLPDADGAGRVRAARARAARARARRRARARPLRRGAARAGRRDRAVPQRRGRRGGRARRAAARRRGRAGGRRRARGGRRGARGDRRLAARAAGPAGGQRGQGRRRRRRRGRAAGRSRSRRTR